ncbi:hypothetical protein [Phaeobacter sp. B1627]|uniref:hypothetical protein n=1 Tax=Phaeobacter sp. B1627 TaxID=2583809 RepID=UPI001118D7D0|nr:hypothetical protein [Phaeobacter sp. B1627]TNJ47813.1 hypothetical protein FGE21_04440 [Phaeobacter sp. B1627]
MFLIRRFLGLIRLYSFVLVCGALVIGVDYDMQAREAGAALRDYTPQAYLGTVQRRLRGQDRLLVVPEAGGGLQVTVPAPEMTTPLDLALVAARGLAAARASLLGLPPGDQDIVALQDPAATGSAPFGAASGRADAGPAGAAANAMADESAPRQTPCVRRNNVLSC